MDKKTVLTTCIQAVVAFFGSFGAIFLNLLPHTILAASYIIGFAQFVCLIIFLLMKATLFKNAKSSANWKIMAIIMAGLFLVSSYLYYQHYRKHYTNVGKSETMVVTGEFIPEELAKCNDPIIMRDNKLQLTCEEFLMSNKNYGNYRSLFINNSIEYNSGVFIILYLFVVLSAFTSIFALVEIIIRNMDVQGKP